MPVLFKIVMVRIVVRGIVANKYMERRTNMTGVFELISNVCPSSRQLTFKIYVLCTSTVPGNIIFIFMEIMEILESHVTIKF